MKIIILEVEMWKWCFLVWFYTLPKIVTAWVKVLHHEECPMEKGRECFLGSYELNLLGFFGSFGIV